MKRPIEIPSGLIGDYAETADYAPDPFDLTCRKEAVERLRDIVSTLPERQRKVIDLRYCGEKELTLEEVARRMSLSRERVRQIESRGLRLIRHPNHSRRLKGFFVDEPDQEDVERIEARREADRLRRAAKEEQEDRERRARARADSRAALDWWARREAAWVEERRRASERDRLARIAKNLERDRNRREWDDLEESVRQAWGRIVARERCRPADEVRYADPEARSAILSLDFDRRDEQIGIVRRAYRALNRVPDSSRGAREAFVKEEQLNALAEILSCHGVLGSWVGMEPER